MNEAIGLLPSVPDVTLLSWSQLNMVLLECEDVPTLQAWLTAAVSDGRATRIKRVYGRLSAVRRTSELKVLGRKTSLKERSK